MKWKCFFNGHVHRTNIFNPQYEPQCSRCLKHDYFDSIHADPSCRYVKSIFHSYEFTVRGFWGGVKAWLLNKFRTVKCADCNKYYKRFGFYVGDHNNCLPF